MLTLTLTLAFFGLLILAGLMYLPYPPHEYSVLEAEAERRAREEHTRVIAQVGAAERPLAPGRSRRDVLLVASRLERAKGEAARAPRVHAAAP